VKYSLSHLSDRTLLRDLATLVTRDHATTAELLAHLAEVDARRLYLPAAYPSMYAYCVQELNLSEDSACKRIRAARAARSHPSLFAAVADGRLHLSGVCLLAPHLRPDNANELVEVCARKSKVEIEQLLAERFARPDVPTRIQPIALPQPLELGSINDKELGTANAARGAESSSRTSSAVLVDQGPSQPSVLSAPGRIEPRPRVTPLAPQHFAIQFTVVGSTRDKLRRAQELLGHQVPLGDLAQVFDRALDALIRQLEKAKFAATDKPRRPPETNSSRHIPAHVKRAVLERDGGRCTFVSERGQRCQERARLEFDHVDPVARGGRANVSGIRLRCRAHNQYEAERFFGAEFMKCKREVRPAAQERPGAANGSGFRQKRGENDGPACADAILRR
jgi:hypothetical protein